MRGKYPRKTRNDAQCPFFRKVSIYILCSLLRIQMTPSLKVNPPTYLKISIFNLSKPL